MCCGVYEGSYIVPRIYTAGSPCFYQLDGNMPGGCDTGSYRIDVYWYNSGAGMGTGIRVLLYDLVGGTFSATWEKNDIIPPLPCYSTAFQLAFLTDTGVCSYTGTIVNITPIYP